MSFLAHVNEFGIPTRTKLMNQ